MCLQKFIQVRYKITQASWSGQGWMAAWVWVAVSSKNKANSALN